MLLNLLGQAAFKSSTVLTCPSFFSFVLVVLVVSSFWRRFLRLVYFTMKCYQLVVQRTLETENYRTFRIYNIEIGVIPFKPAISALELYCPISWYLCSIVGSKGQMSVLDCVFSRKIDRIVFSWKHLLEHSHCQDVALRACMYFYFKVCSHSATTFDFQIGVRFILYF